MIELREVQQVGSFHCRKCGRRLVWWKRGYAGPDYGFYHIRCAEALAKEGKAILLLAAVTELA